MMGTASILYAPSQKGGRYRHRHYMNRLCTVDKRKGVVYVCEGIYVTEKLVKRLLPTKN